jgi:hypothetical protein
MLLRQPAISADCPGRQDVAGLRSGGGLAVECIDAVHREHGQDAAGTLVAQDHGVTIAGLPGDVEAAAVAVDLQFLATAAVEDADVDQSTAASARLMQPARGRAASRAAKFFMTVSLSEVSR